MTDDAQAAPAATATETLESERPVGAIDGTPTGETITLEDLITKTNTALRECPPGLARDCLYNLGRVVVDQAQRLAKADAVIARLRQRERIHLLPGGES